MKFTLKIVGFSADESLKKYVDLKLVSVVTKLLKRENILAAATLDIEIDRAKHHKKGLVWRAEANTTLPHSFLRCEAEGEDPREAIDLLAAELSGEIKKYKEKKLSKMKRGARRAKTELKLDPAARRRGGGRRM